MKYSCCVRRTACVATLAAAFFGATGQAARADDGTPQLPDPAAIVATATDAAPATSDPSGNAVVPVVSEPIPPAVPASAPTADTPTADPAPPPAPAGDPQVASSEPSSKPATTPPSDPPTTAPQGGNTTSDNSTGITDNTPTPATGSSSQTLIWNWYWNCDGEPSTPDPPPTPDPTAGAVTIIWNWHWNCPDAPPPTASATGTTVCVGCNIAISVRVGSPGDSAGVTQTTGTDASSIATDVATAAQAAAQVLPEAVPQQPAVPPPAPPQSATPEPVMPQPLAPAPPLAPTLPLAPVSPAVSVLAPFLPPLAFGADDAPRHGAPDFGADSGAAPPPRATIHVRTLFRRATTAPSAVAIVTTVHVTSSPWHAPRHAARRQPVADARAPVPFPPAPPRTPAPVSFAPALTETHDAGAFTTFAAGAGALGALILVLLGYLAPGLQTVRSLPGSAQPDPPG